MAAAATAAAALATDDHDVDDNRVEGVQGVEIVELNSILIEVDASTIRVSPHAVGRVKRCMPIRALLLPATTVANVKSNWERLALLSTASSTNRFVASTSYK